MAASWQILALFVVTMVTPSQAATRGQGNPNIIKMHGIFMSLAWILFASVAIVLARYYKDCWPDTKMGGTKIWFQLHRILLAICVILTAGGFITAFIFVGGWSDLMDAGTALERLHPPLGIIITVLAFANPFFALCRNKMKRVVFNWGHWFIGTAAHVAAIFNIFLGLSLPMSDYLAYDWMTWVLCGFVLYHLLTEITMQIIRCYLAPRSGGEEAVELQPKGEEAPSKKKRLEGFRTVLVILYVMVAAACSIAISVGLGLHPV